MLTPWLSVQVAFGNIELVNINGHVRYFANSLRFHTNSSPRLTPCLVNHHRVSIIGCGVNSNNDHEKGLGVFFFFFFHFYSPSDFFVTFRRLKLRIFCSGLHKWRRNTHPLLCEYFTLRNVIQGRPTGSFSSLEVDEMTQKVSYKALGGKVARLYCSETSSAATVILKRLTTLVAKPSEMLILTNF